MGWRVVGVVVIKLPHISLAVALDSLLHNVDVHIRKENGFKRVFNWLFENRKRICTIVQYIIHTV